MNISKEVLQAMFGDIDLDAASDSLHELGLPIRYSDEAIAKIDAAVNKLADKAADLKRSEAPRAKRRAVRDDIDRLLVARGFLYRLRPAQLGDMTVTPNVVGGND